jgi:hypothetical protein
VKASREVGVRRWVNGGYIGGGEGGCARDKVRKRGLWSEGGIGRTQRGGQTRHGLRRGCLLFWKACIYAAGAGWILNNIIREGMRGRGNSEWLADLILI